MCVSVHPGHFDQTMICLYDPDPRLFGLPIRVLLYQNRVFNRHPGPNALLLHIDTLAPVSPHNFIATTGFPNIMQDMVAALNPPQVGTFGRTMLSPVDTVQVFDVGIYTVVLAQSARLIPNALQLVPEHKRPALNRELFEFYAQAFPPNWAVALCCFNSSASPEPLMFWYEPDNPSVFRAPALDEHNGGIPQPGEPVDVDHWLMVGSHRMEGGVEVNYSQWDIIPQKVRQLLPQRIRGARFTGHMPNGDFTMSANMLNGSNPFLPKGEILRLPPPRLS